jgi:hypothetical protein
MSAPLRLLLGRGLAKAEQRDGQCLQEQLHAEQRQPEPRDEPMRQGENLE